MITRFIQATNTGKGFITHDDWETMSFSNIGSNIWQVSSEVDADITNWRNRVFGTDKTQQEANDIVFENTKYNYTLKEFFTTVLTSDEIKSMLDNVNDSNVSNLLDLLFSSDNNNLDISNTDFIQKLDLVTSKIGISAARKNAVLIGKTK